MKIIFALGAFFAGVNFGMIAAALARHDLSPSWFIVPSLGVVAGAAVAIDGLLS